MSEICQESYPQVKMDRIGLPELTSTVAITVSCRRSNLVPVMIDFCCSRVSLTCVITALLLSCRRRDALELRCCEEAARMLSCRGRPSLNSGALTSGMAFLALFGAMRLCAEGQGASMGSRGGEGSTDGTHGCVCRCAIRVIHWW
jgi:hypothetical protein